MNWITKSIGRGLLGILFLSIATSLWAGVIDEFDVSFDYDQNYSVKTKGGRNIVAVEFDVKLTSNVLGLKEFETYGYCVDVNQHISKGVYYDYDLAFLGDFEESDKYYQAAWLIDQYAPGKGLGLDRAQKTDAAALQGLIWEVLYGDAYMVTNSGSSGSIDYNIGSQYSSYKQALGNLVLTPSLKTTLASSYMVAVDSNHQDLMIWIDGQMGPQAGSAAMPEPGTLVLVGLGFMGLIVIKGRGRPGSLA